MIHVIQSGIRAMRSLTKQFAILIPLICAAVCAEAAVRTWDGGGVDNRWMTAANWAEDQLPNAGDDLLFPAGAARAASFNDFPAGTGFRTIIVLSNSYQFTGAGITLSGGVTVSCGPAPSQVQVWLPITLVAPQAFSVQSGQNTGLSFHGRIDTQLHDLTFIASGWISVLGELAGGGRISKLGHATLSFSLATNSYWGVTHVQQGVLHISNSYGLGNASAETIVDAGAELEYPFPNPSVPVREPLVLSGRLGLHGGNRWSGPISLPGNNARIVGTGGSAIDGVISGPGGLRVAGAGPFYLNGDNTYQGLSEFEGEVMINGAQTPSDLLFRGTYLSGGGAVGNLTMTGGLAKTFAPGSNGVDGFTATRGMTLDSFTTLAVELGLPLPFGNNLDVRGSVNLENARLQVNMRTPPAQPNQQFIIVRNDGTDPINGTFAGLPEGALVPAEAGLVFRISYGSGGVSNDVTLTAIGPATSTWDGGGPDNLWTTPANWVGDVAPQPGNVILFQDMPGPRTNFNDFPSGTTFQEIIVHSETTIQGNQVALNAGVQIWDESELALGIRLNFPQRIFLNDDVDYTRISGNIDNNGHTLTLAPELDEQTTLEVLGTISGTGGLIVSNRGTVRLTGTNTYSGSTRVLAPAVLQVGNPMALGTAGATIDESARLEVEGSGEFANPLKLLGILSSVSGARYVGPIESRGGIIEGSIEIAGVISGDSPSIYGGTVVFSGANTYTGELWLFGGTLVVNGDQPSGAIHLYNGTLAGTGRVGTVTSGNGYSGIAPGIGLDEVGVLSIGDATLSAITGVRIRLNGPADHDVLRVNGALHLDNPSLAISLGYTPTIGQTMVIIENDGTDPIEGSFFASLEGITISVYDPAFTAHKFQITYQGGDGNDVAITFVANGPEMRMWSGQGADAYWTTPANWFGNVAPQPGDALGFANTTQRVNTNDFPPDTIFDSITIHSGSFRLFGERIRLNRGIALAGALFAGEVLLPIRLNSNQTFASSSPAVSLQSLLIISGPVDTAGYKLTFGGAGTVYVYGEISGAGSLTKYGGGHAVLFGTNTYSGLTEILGGWLLIDNPAALGSVEQPTIVSVGTRLFTQGAHSFPEPLVLAGTLDFVGARWIGPIETVSPNATLYGGTVEDVIEGVIFGSGGIRVEGQLTLAGNNTYTGPTLVSLGTLVLMGQQPQSPVLLQGGTLFGSGEAGPVTGLSGTVLGGTFGPTPINTMLTTGDLFLQTPARLRAVAFSSSHHQVHVQGSVTLDQPELDLVTHFYQGVPFNQPMTIIQNDGTDPVAGTFSGLPEGRVARIGTNGVYRITYTGGDGNDVVITRVTAEPATILSLTTIGEGLQIKARGTPLGLYYLESADHLNPAIPWISGPSRFAGSDGLVYLNQYPAPTNSMRFYRIRSGDF